jgi:peptide/nickel transport system substrate-binding protein
MKQRILLFFLTIIVSVSVFISCGKKDAMKDVSAVIGISGDADSFNPIVANTAISGEVTGAVYPMMFDISFDLEAGKLVYKPGLVKSWEFQNKNCDVLLHLRHDVHWEDGVLVTPEDIKFSFGLYGDPDVASPRSNYVDNMIMTNGRFDVEKSITIVNDSTMIFHFTHAYPQQLFHLNLSPIPKHIYANADKATLESNPANEKPIGAGPFKLEQWVRQQQFVLAQNPKSNLPYPGKLNKVIFRIITEPTTRLTELKKGTIDVLSPIYPQDVKELQEKSPDIKIVTRPPRRYDYIGWANIDYEEYHKSNGKSIRPHPLFGDRVVRQALTYGINRNAILEAQLGQYGEVAVTDFSPVFRWALNSDLIPYPYKPDIAKQMLKNAGWVDSDGDGILDRNGRKFEFTLYYNIGNKTREYAATVVQQNLKQLGMKVTLQPVEGAVLFKSIAEKKYDAWVAGFEVGLEIDPSNHWGDIRNPFNNCGFMNPRVAELIRLSSKVDNDRDAARYWKEIQAILHHEQPCTFLYWIKEIVGVNRRLKNTNVNILGITDGLWNWTVGDPNAYATY